MQSRKRKKADVLDKISEIERLQGIIGDLSQIFIEYSESSQDAIQSTNARSQELIDLTNRFVSKAKEAGGDDISLRPEETASRERNLSSRNLRIDSLQDESANVETHSTYSNTIKPTRSLGWSPRLSYGAFLTLPNMQPDRSVLNIESAIRAGRDSFAARLFYATVDYSRKAMEDVSASPQTLLRVHELTCQIQPLETALRRTQQCFERLHLETLPGDDDPTPAERTDMDLTADLVKEHLQSLGYRVENYVDVHDVEHYLKEVWSIQLSTSRITKKSMSEDIGGRLKFVDTFVYDTNALLAKIASSSVCFGDGPRYPKGVLDQYMRKLLSGV